MPLDYADIYDSWLRLMPLIRHITTSLSLRWPAFSYAGYATDIAAMLPWIIAAALIDTLFTRHYASPLR